MLKESIKSKYNKKNFETLLKNIKNTQYNFFLIDLRGVEHEYKINDNNIYVYSNIFNRFIKIEYQHLDINDLKGLFEKFKVKDDKNEH